MLKGWVSKELPYMSRLSKWYTKNLNPFAVFCPLQNIDYKMILKVILPSTVHFSLLPDLYSGHAPVWSNLRHFFSNICGFKCYQCTRTQSEGIFVKDEQLPICRTKKKKRYITQFLSSLPSFPKHYLASFPFFLCFLSNHEEKPVKLAS